VKDCSAENGHFEAPNDIPLWYKLAEYDVGDESELIDESSISEIIFNLDECVCAEGYFMDSNHKCVSCKAIHWDCTTCSNSQTCTSCGSDINMLSPPENEVVTCQPKIEFCELPMYEQPDQLKVYDYEGVLKRVCERCKPGYYWRDPEDGKHNGNCVPCLEAMDHCNLCEHSKYCTECTADFILTYKRDGCQSLIPGCAYTEGVYDHNREFWTCPNCMKGYYKVPEGEHTIDYQC